MSWKVVARPQAEDDIIQAADWYETQRAGLGGEFIEEILAVFDALEIKSTFELPTASDQEHPLALSQKIPYRVIYEVIGRQSACDHCSCSSCRPA